MLIQVRIRPPWPRLRAQHPVDRGDDQHLEDRIGQNHRRADHGGRCGQIELRTMMPASAMKPIIEVAVNGAPNSQCPPRMPMQVSGIGVRITGAP